MKKRIISTLTALIAVVALIANNYLEKNSKQTPEQTSRQTYNQTSNQLSSNKQYSRQSNKKNNNSSQSNQSNSSNQPSNYKGSLRTLWSKVYPKKGKTFYCGYDFDNSKRSARQNNINAEHVFPMSWATKDLQCGTRKQCQKRSHEFRVIEADLHNIYPSNVKINKERSNFKFGNVSGEKREFGKCDFEVNRKYRVAEPNKTIHGEIARSMLYMQYQYGLTLRKDMLKQVKQWDKQDPPNKEEKRRNSVIKREHGRDNPFISKYPFKQ